MLHYNAPIFSNVIFGIFTMQFNSEYVYPIHHHHKPKLISLLRLELVRGGITTQHQ